VRGIGGRKEKSLKGEQQRFKSHHVSITGNIDAARKNLLGKEKNMGEQREGRGGNCYPVRLLSALLR